MTSCGMFNHYTVSSWLCVITSFTKVCINYNRPNSSLPQNSYSWLINFFFFFFFKEYWCTFYSSFRQVNTFTSYTAKNSKLIIWMRHVHGNLTFFSVWMTFGETVECCSFWTMILAVWWPTPRRRGFGTADVQYQHARWWQESVLLDA